MVDRVHGGPGASRAPLTGDADPDISHLARAVEAMLLRLEQRDLQLRALARRRITAQEEERKRIARGLHDDTSQALSMMIIRLEQLERDLPPDRPNARARAREAGALANHTLEELRALIGGLRPTMLDDLGLGPAIHWYSRVTLAEAGITVCASGLDEALRLPPAIEITLFRIAQEAISNVVRHAGAGVVTVRLSRADGQVCLVLEDDGHGFDVNGVTGQALRLRRFGLLGIHERAELIGARVELDSAPGRGTRLRVCAPLDVPAAWDTPA
jgi:signal transduction histidine kinase